ncbi:MAG: hypothetical protein QGI21_04195 [Candidatus Poseidoniaceae archaeon]|nr:hypothetical protein [Candidatus Poseidoniaceae archaeon]
MDGMNTLEEAVEAETRAILDRIERLAMISALIMLCAAAWLAWPTLMSAMDGGSLIQGIGYSLIILTWGIFVQDLGLMDGRAKTRVAAVTTIAYLPILVMGIPHLFGDTLEFIGALLMICVSGSLFVSSRKMLIGGIEVMRFRSVMGLLSVAIAIPITIGNDLTQFSGILQLSFCGIGVLLVITDWFSSDNHRAERKLFDRRLNALENRILELKSQGSSVDQAASLIMTAREEGHRDPPWGMKLLNEAEEDIERSLSLAGDVEIIRDDALDSVETAENIAPIVKRPRKAWNMGIREVELGSLREGETLFRQAKKRANEIIEWWEKAENAIREGSAKLAKSDHPPVHLEELLVEAKKKLNSEQPKKAWELAIVIPNQLNASDDALDNAANSLKDAKRQLKAANGIHKSPLKERLVHAEKALESGDHAQAKGLADGVVREINSEREAMEDVRRALRQKVHLISRWNTRDDSQEWDAKLVELEKFADEKQWSHAAVLLERLTKELDSEGKAEEEANELLTYVKDGWKTLRNQCEASGIKATDDERRSCEEAVAIAEEAIKGGNIDHALESLGLADEFMEKLRRRV